VERRHPHLADGNSVLSLEREELILKEIKRRENKRVTAMSFKKMGRQIRGHVKPSSLKNTSLTNLEVQDANRDLEADTRKVIYQGTHCAAKY
jgi:hypothetical protein